MSGVVQLYNDGTLYESLALQIGFHESGDKFESKIVDIFGNLDECETEFRGASPEGQLPVIAKDGVWKIGFNDCIASLRIGRKPDEECNASLSRLIDSVDMNALVLCVVGLHVEKATKKLRWPFTDPSLRDKIFIYAREKTTKGQLPLSYVEVGEDNAEELLKNVDKVLDAMEDHLKRDDRMGPWLYGPVFAIVDVKFAAFLVALYQIGLDDRWTDGQRPHVSMYANMAFNRASVLEATKWKNHEHDFINLVQRDGLDGQVYAAKFGLGMAAAMAGIYVARKLFKK